MFCVRKCAVRGGEVEAGYAVATREPRHYGVCMRCMMTLCAMANEVAVLQ